MDLLKTIGFAAWAAVGLAWGLIYTARHLAGAGALARNRGERAGLLGSLDAERRRVRELEEACERSLNLLDQPLRCPLCRGMIVRRLNGTGRTTYGNEAKSER